MKKTILLTARFLNFLANFFTINIELQQLKRMYQAFSGTVKKEHSTVFILNEQYQNVPFFHLLSSNL